MLIHATSHPNERLLSQLKQDRGLYFESMANIFKDAQADKRIIKEFTDPGGTHYRGTLRNGKPQGMGTRTFANGDFCEGAFFDGQLQGQWKGKETYASGAVYVGSFVEGKRQGMGTLTLANGDFCEGSFVDGKRRGQWKGKETYADGAVYVGSFVEGKRQGQGTLKRANGSVYVGSFVEGKRQGQGTLKWANGNVYVGSFVEGSIQGMGTLKLADGSVYVGSFVNGQPDPDISFLENSLFSKVLLGINECGARSTLLTGVMHKYLSQNGYEKEGAALRSAHELQLCTGAQRKSRAPLLLEGLKKDKPQLLLYGYKEHSMGLSLSYSEEEKKVDCAIFNSGSGLKYHTPRFPHHISTLPPLNIMRGQQFQTMKVIRVPEENITPDKIEQFLNCADFTTPDEAYHAVQEIPGSKIVVFSDEEAIWQTQQNGKNCTIEWIFAYLKNTMSYLEYKKMRLTLFQDCQSIQATAPWATPEMKEALKKRIKETEYKIKMFFLRAR